MQGSFTAQVDAAIARQKELMATVYRGAALKAIEVMQEPTASKETVKRAVAAGVGLGRPKKSGGRGVSKSAFGPISNPGGSGHMPVATGFLRASLVIGIGPLNLSLTRPPEDGEGRSYTWDEGRLLSIASAERKDVIEARYTAVYARKVEHQRGFVRLTGQQWPRIVAETVAEATAGG